MATHDIQSSPDPDAMPIALNLNAISFLNQVSRSEAQRIERALERLARNYGLRSRSHVDPVAETGGRHGRTLSSYGAARDIRVFFFVEGDVINVVEIIRRSQIESIRALPMSAP